LIVDPGMERAARLIDRAADQGVFPGAEALVNASGERLLHYQTGYAALVPEPETVGEKILWDIASLTKVVASATAFMLLVDEGSLDLDATLGQILGIQGDLAGVTVAHLLSHSSGLRDWAPFYKDWKDDHAAFLNALRRKLRKEKIAFVPGKGQAYSDLGFIILHEVLERVTGSGFDAFCRKRIFDPLGMKDTFFVPLEAGKPRQESQRSFAATENCPWRGRVLRGEVHDENAWACGGVAAHSGLFSNALDLERFALALLDCRHGRSDAISPGTLARFWSRGADAPDSGKCLGWDTPSPVDSASGRFFGKGSVGHLGFTGTSLWIDVDRQIVVILLSNRVHPSRDNEEIKRFRPAFHDAVMEALS